MTTCRGITEDWNTKFADICSNPIQGFSKATAIDSDECVIWDCSLLTAKGYLKTYKVL